MAMLAKFERQVMVSLSKGEVNSMHDAEANEKVPIGSAYNVWPSDRLAVGGMNPSNPQSWAEEDNRGLTLGNAFKIFVYDPADFVELKRLTTGSNYCRRRETGAEVDFF